MWLENNLCKLLYRSYLYKNIHTYIYKMDKAYLRRLDSGQIDLTFYYKNLDLKVDRQFNFCRQVSEPVSTFLERVRANLQKAIMKKKKKKSVEGLQEIAPVTAVLINNNSEVEGDTLWLDLIASNGNIILQVLENRYTIIINAPFVNAIALPNSILANFPTYPSKFETINTEKQLCEFTWYTSDDKIDWKRASSGFMYVPANTDVNSFLKISCTPKNENNEGPITEAISDVPVDASPGFCPFETRHKFTTHKCTGNEFRVLTYNILADLYCDSEFTRTVLHPYCPPYALSIDYRKQLIMKEVIGYNSDIICLQEVDKKVYNYDLEPVLSAFDYDSYFSLKGGLVAEGLSCFYNRKRFRLLETKSIILADELDKNPTFANIWDHISKNEKLKERIIQRTTAVQTLALEAIETGNVLLVANTHLYFHPDADHVRLLQGTLCIKYIEHIFNEIQLKYKNRNISLIFCGDFNSVPECGIFKLYTTGSVPETIVDWESNKEEAVVGLSVTQPFKLASACGRPKYTNFTVGFADCLDYIFYDTTKLAVTQVVPLPTDEELMQHTALPSIVFPSDHISLAADLKFL